MDRILKDNDLVTIDGNRKLFVLKTFDHNNEHYAYCQDVTDLEKDNKLYIIVKEIPSDTEAGLDILTDVNEIENVLQTLRTLLV